MSAGRSCLNVSFLLIKHKGRRCSACYAVLTVGLVVCGLSGGVQSKEAEKNGEKKSYFVVSTFIETCNIPRKKLQTPLFLLVKC